MSILNPCDNCERKSVCLIHTDIILNKINKTGVIIGNSSNLQLKINCLFKKEVIKDNCSIRVNIINSYLADCSKCNFKNHCKQFNEVEKFNERVKEEFNLISNILNESKSGLTCHIRCSAFDFNSRNDEKDTKENI